MAMAEEDVRARVDNLESKVTEIDGRVTTLETKFEVLMTKLDMFIADSRETRARQDADMREMREDMKTLNQRIDSTMSSIHNLTIAAMAGIGAIAIAVVISLFR